MSWTNVDTACVLVLALSPFAWVTNEIWTRSSTERAWAYATRVQVPIADVRCVEFDVDQDGMVPCTFVMDDGTKAEFRCRRSASVCRKEKIDEARPERRRR